MNIQKPASARQATLSGVLILVAGFLSLMVMNPTISASLTSSPNAPERSVS